MSFRTREERDAYRRAVLAALESDTVESVCERFSPRVSRGTIRRWAVEAGAPWRLEGTVKAIDRGVARYSGGRVLPQSNYGSLKGGRTIVEDE
jgi:hypothetical protein